MTVFSILFGANRSWRDRLFGVIRQTESVPPYQMPVVARAAESPIAVGVHSSMEISGIVTTEARVEISKPLAM